MPKPFECSSGTYTGTGAAQSVSLGFKPKLVLMFNVTDGDCICGMIDSMADATGFSIVLAVAAIAAQGITLSASGFSLGTDALVNENAKVYSYVAVGGN